MTTMSERPDFKLLAIEYDENLEWGELLSADIRAAFLAGVNAALEAAAQWHEAQRDRARQIISATSGEVSVSHITAVAEHKRSADAIRSLKPSETP